MKGLEGSKDFEILEENWEVVHLFLRLYSQWNYSQGVTIGLNYQSIEFILKVEKIDSCQWRDLMDGIQIMEAEALRVYREREKKNV
jgi:hypothetical protein